MSTRIDYDTVAVEYDQQPFRGKNVDPELINFVEIKGTHNLKILDLACGTGSQLLANQSKYPNMQMTGSDLSKGMLQEARAKSNKIQWIEADLTALPLPNNCYDYVSCQFAFHHVPNKLKGLAEVHRVTAPSGRFVMKNISPHHMQDIMLFKVFPQALEQDLQDYMEPKRIAAHLEEIGFSQVKSEFETIEFPMTLGALFTRVSDKMSSSELALLSDEHYQKGLKALQDQIDQMGAEYSFDDQVVLMTIIADK
jgi:ubiquinone/menaquinone biosynthesis C-methylase UbiE